MLSQTNNNMQRYDSGMIMVRKKIENPFVFFAFSRPFTGKLWLLLAVVVIVTSVTFFFVEGALYHRQYPDPPQLSLRGSFFTGTHAVLGTGNFEAKSVTGRFISLSMAFLCVVIIGGYTANLASFLVQENNNRQINNLDDAVIKGKTICLWAGSPHQRYFDSTYPGYKQVERVSSPTQSFDMEPIFEKLQSGKCNIGLVSVDAFNSAEKDSALNGDCNLEWVGSRIIYPSEASFPIAFSEAKCSYLIRNVFNIHLTDMNNITETTETSNLEQIFSRYDEASGRAQSWCENQASEDNQELDIDHFGGAISLHAIILFVSIVYTFAIRRKEYFCRDVESGSIADDDGKKYFTDVNVNQQRVMSTIQEHGKLLIRKGGAGDNDGKKDFTDVNQQQQVLSTIQEQLQALQGQISKLQKLSEEVAVPTDEIPRTSISLMHGEIDDF
jgi:hypothetical protein